MKTIKINQETCFSYKIDEEMDGNIYIGEYVNNKPVLTVSTAEQLFDISPDEALHLGYTMIAAANEIINHPEKYRPRNFYVEEKPKEGKPTKVKVKIKMPKTYQL